MIAITGFTAAAAASDSHLLLLKLTKPSNSKIGPQKAVAQKQPKGHVFEESFEKMYFVAYKKKPT